MSDMELKEIAITTTIPDTADCQYTLTPNRTIIFWMILITAAPMRAPAGLPIPPVRDTPPITDEAMEFIGQFSPIADWDEPSLATYKIPASAEINPTIE